MVQKSFSYRIYQNIMLAFWLLITTFVVAQQQEVQAIADSTQIQIGSEFQVILSTKTEATSKVVFPEQNIFGKLEVLESHIVDTIKSEKDHSKIELIKKYSLTQFDTGHYVIPPFTVLIDNKPFLTDSLQIQVTGVAVDTLKQNLYDIKDFTATSDSTDFSVLQKILLIMLFLILIGLVVAFLMVRKKKIKKQQEKKYTPIEKATIGLKELDKKELVEEGAIKEYYSELTDIVKTYLEEAVKFPALENTTEELILNLKDKAVECKLVLSDKVVADLQKVLEEADLVKFAKSKPIRNEIITHTNIVESTINTIHEVFPEKTPEELEFERNQELKLAFERKQRIKKMRSRIVFASAIALTIGLAYWIATSGINIAKDFLTGSATSKYVNSEWVTSKYGQYPIKIETPEVLVRTKDTVTMPEFLLRDSNVAQFRFQAPDNTLFIGLDNYKPQQLFSVVKVLDMEKMTEHIINSWARVGFKNILVEQQVLDMPNGIEGVKTFGTMIYIDSESKKSKKMYYEVLILKYQNSIQQLMVYMPESDPNTKYIIDRIIKSVEIELAN